MMRTVDKNRSGSRSNRSGEKLRRQDHLQSQPEHIGPVFMHHVTAEICMASTVSEGRNIEPKEESAWFSLGTGGDRLAFFLD